MIGEEVRRRRENLGLTGAQLAARAGMAPSAVSQIETGKRTPSSSSVVKLAEGLGVEVGDLYPKKAQAPLPLDSSVGGADDPAEAATMITALANEAAKLATAWNQDVEFYEQHGRSLFPYRTFEMSCTVVVLYQHFWRALSVLQHHAESLGLNPDPATWEPQLKNLLLEAGSKIRALAELYALIDKTGRKSDADREDSRAMREEFDMSPPAFLTEDPQWPAAIERARAAAGIA